MIRVIALGRGYDQELLETVVSYRKLEMFPEAGLHAEDQIELCKKLAKEDGELVIATFSSYVYEYFEHVKHAKLYTLTSDRLIYCDEREEIGYEALVGKAYDMIDKLKCDMMFGEWLWIQEF